MKKIIKKDEELDPNSKEYLVEMMKGMGIPWAEKNTHLFAKNNDLSKTEAEKIIDTFTKSVAGALSSDTQIALTGFGAFEKKFYAETNGRNPKTGDVIKIPAHHRPSFRAGKNLKDACN